jgi:hypothetical protein
MVSLPETLQPTCDALGITLHLNRRRERRGGIQRVVPSRDPQVEAGLALRPRHATRHRLHRRGFDGQTESGLLRKPVGPRAAQSFAKGSGATVLQAVDDSVVPHRTRGKRLVRLLKRVGRPVRVQVLGLERAHDCKSRVQLEKRPIELIGFHHDQIPFPCPSVPVPLGHLPSDQHGRIEPCLFTRQSGERGDRRLAVRACYPDHPLTLQKRPQGTSSLEQRHSAVPCGGQLGTLGRDRRAVHDEVGPGRVRRVVPGIQLHATLHQLIEALYSVAITAGHPVSDFGKQDREPAHARSPDPDQVHLAPHRGQLVPRGQPAGST